MMQLNMVSIEMLPWIFAAAFIYGLVCRVWKGD